MSNLRPPVIRETTGPTFTTGTTLTIVVPPGSQYGDILLLTIGSDGTLAADDGGWFQIQYPIGTDIQCRTYWRPATDSEPANYTCTRTGGSISGGGMLRISDADTIAPINTSQSGTANGEGYVNCGPVTTDQSNCLIVATFSQDNNVVSTPDTGYPAGYTGLWSQDTALANQMAHGCCYKILPTAGTENPGLQTNFDNITEEYAEITIAIVGISAPAENRTLNFPALDSPALQFPKRKPVGTVEIDWQNQITKNLISCVPFIDDIKDLTGYMVLSITDSSTYLHVDGQKMIRQDFQNIAVDTLVTANIEDFRFGDGDFTIFVIVIPRQQVSGRDIVSVGKWDGSINTQNEWNIGRNFAFTSTDYTPAVAIRIGTTDYFCPESDPVRDWRVGYPLFHLALRRGETTLENWDDADGILTKATRTIPTGAINNSTTRKAQFGTFGGDGDFNSAQDILFFAAWDRALTDAEIRALYDNPYQFLKPRIR
jgi:hypothetical protein